jgi:hypothetical protein
MPVVLAAMVGTEDGALGFAGGAVCAQSDAAIRQDKTESWLNPDVRIELLEKEMTL